MSVKQKIQATTAALVAVAAIGFYYVGKGGKFDDDHNIVMTVEIVATRANAGIVSVYINGAERLTEPMNGTKWTDSMWVRPTERVVLRGWVYLRGTITCTITDGEQTLTDASKGNVTRWQDGACTVTYIGR